MEMAVQLNARKRYAEMACYKEESNAMTETLIPAMAVVIYVNWNLVVMALWKESRNAMTAIPFQVMVAPMSAALKSAGMGLQIIMKTVIRDSLVQAGHSVVRLVQPVLMALPVQSARARPGHGHRRGAVGARAPSPRRADRVTLALGGDGRPLPIRRIPPQEVVEDRGQEAEREHEGNDAFPSLDHHRSSLESDTPRRQRPG